MSCHAVSRLYGLDFQGQMRLPLRRPRHNRQLGRISHMSPLRSRAMLRSLVELALLALASSAAPSAAAADQRPSVSQVRGGAVVKASKANPPPTERLMMDPLLRPPPNLAAPAAAGVGAMVPPTAEQAGCARCGPANLKASIVSLEPKLRLGGEPLPIVARGRVDSHPSPSDIQDPN
jgi:hypothetical protein